MTAAAILQHMTQHHDHIAQAVIVVDGCENFAIQTSGHILIAINLIHRAHTMAHHSGIIILKARHLSTL